MFRNVVLTSLGHLLAIVIAGLIAISFVQSSGFLTGWFVFLGVQVVFSSVVSSQGLAALRRGGLLTSWSVSLSAAFFYAVGTVVVLFLLLSFVMDVPPILMTIEILLIGLGSLAATLFVRPRPA